MYKGNKIINITKLSLIIYVDEIILKRKRNFNKNPTEFLTVFKLLKAEKTIVSVKKIK